MLKRLMLYAAAAFTGVALAVLLSAVFTVTEMSGSGMEPNIRSGSMVLINKLAYGIEKTGEPQVGDVVAFRSDVYSEDGEGSILIRRVAASFGDQVEIKDNIFYLNGEVYDEYMEEASDMEDMKKTTLKKYEIFVLCDDRTSSMDSRNEAVGILDSRDCIGKVCFR